MLKSRKVAALRRAAGDDGFEKGDEIVFFCPWCKHHKRKLSVNVSTDVMHCWVCGRGGSILKLLKLRGETEESREYESELRSKRIEKQEPEKKYDRPKLPRECRPLSEPSRSPYVAQALDYLSSRGVTADDIWLYRLSYCEDGEYAGRIIFPSFDRDGQLNFFVGRSIVPGQLKYKHGNFDKDVVFNDILIDWKKPVVLVEGPFDAIKAGTQAIALQSNQLPRESVLFSKLVSARVPVYVALDSDAVQAAAKITHTLTSYGVDARFVDLAWFKDPGEMTKDQFKVALRHADEGKLDPLKLMLKCGYVPRRHA